MIFNNPNIKQQAVNEVYFGKTPELIAIENQLDIFRNKYIGKYINFKSNNDPDLLKFNRMIEDFFGFGCFNLYIANSMIPNAYTQPISGNFDLMLNHKKDLIINKNGYKFNKKYDYCTEVVIHTILIFNNYYSTSEIMAIILHEIGHNFESSINQNRLVLNNIYSISMILRCIHNGWIINLIMNNNSFNKIDIKLTKWIKDNFKLLYFLYQLIDTIKNLIKSGFREINEIFKVMSFGIADINRVGNAMVNKVVNDPLGMLCYSGELVADNFPTMYGYGADIISVMSKFQTEGMDNGSIVASAINKIPIISTLINMNYLPTLILFSIVDEHPYEVTRCLDQVELLRHELNKENIDPKMKKIILKDLNTCEKQLNQLQDISKGIKDPYLVTKFLNKILLKINPDFKYLLLGNKNARFKDYDDTYERISNESTSLMEDLFL